MRPNRKIRKGLWDFPEEESPRGVGGKKKFRFPTWLTILLCVTLALIIITMSIGIWMSNGVMLAVYIGVPAVMLYWPLIIRYVAKRLGAIRLKFVAAVRADTPMTVPVARVMLLYAILFSPGLGLGYLGFALPWDNTALLFYIPAVFLVVIFGCFHSRVWTDLELPLWGYVLYLAGLLIASAVLGLATYGIYMAFG